MPPDFWRIRLMRMPCQENPLTCPLSRYDPWVKRECICFNPRNALYVRRSTVDKNGRVYTIANSDAKCVIKILNNFDGDHQKERYSSGEIEYMKSLV